MKTRLTNNVDRQSALYGSSGGTAAQRYEQLRVDRNSPLKRARDCSKVTIPGLIEDENYGDAGRLDTPYQSSGARGVGHMTSKLAVTLFPTNEHFFKLEIDSLAILASDQNPEMITEFDSALVKVEQAVMRMFETIGGRAAMHEALKHLLVGGNVLLYVSDEGIKVIHLDSYVLCRDPMGNVTEIVVEEEIFKDALPEEYLDEEDDDDDDMGKKMVKIYTCIKFMDDQCHWYQEIKGKEVPGTHGKCAADVAPWIALRQDRVDSEMYGRSYVEQYYGDLLALENLYKAILEASASLSKVLFLCNPNGTTRPRTLSQASNGSIVQGNAADVTVLQAAGKSQDLQIANQTIERIENRLAFAFMLNTAIQRPGERVTAEEIRYMAQELDAGISGLYSILSRELQLPLVRRLIHILRRKRKLPDFPRSEVTGEPLIKEKAVTGIEAIGRGDDRNKLIDFITTANQALGPQAMTQFLNVEEALRRLAASGSIDTTNLVKTKAQLQQEAAAQAEAEQQAQQQQLLETGIKSPAMAQAVKNFQGADPERAAQALSAITSETGGIDADQLTEAV
uniref:Portal protein(gp 16) of the cyanophage P-SCSP1u n=1 Tax=Prochlorococcus phage P-SCSP1u TaxID=2914505 RepID=UPI0029529630|nr:Chain S, Portal protein(gp 16) of the cyanophage P-SCSP1u [Prochlorococcus phage P-SCSP1u]8I4M_T Chain T, Portal protein(gp 16) of the cyanophage P-SCSP1u [Prochlorococcus phage P-SCSP1u]8I4M_U Chain U, Portal protein(gp 16) of the cyanophage P-SCSP1u [Prochlorococcus phage P-SCSP1u]8I4M_V Chain V, Portal protein(gp 16) of the cyanophage P-SCSP1u [Prochlorococcus phage P-SCSP1u]8I4M_W Chain W, Portal protein(gp 16) of the cyanophage P-SCSP1u [Prochlorococcus phage P-SCSP1u]8I4M_X Chain X, P